jgi:hypothetical protein
MCLERHSRRSISEVMEVGRRSFEEFPSQNKTKQHRKRVAAPRDLEMDGLLRGSFTAG